MSIELVFIGYSGVSIELVFRGYSGASIELVFRVYSGFFGDISNVMIKGVDINLKVNYGLVFIYF